MMGDVADYGEWKNGRRATGTVTAGVVFALWAGLALGGAIAGWLLSAYGLVSEAATQTRTDADRHPSDGERLRGPLFLRRRSVPVLLSADQREEPVDCQRTRRAAEEGG